MVTGQYDFDSCDRHTDLEAAREAENVPRAVTQCAHIFSESAQDSDKKVSFCAFSCNANSDDISKTDYAASAMAILEMFGLNTQAESLVGRNVHKHFNILTMRSDLRHLFDHLTFWLEEVIGEVSRFSFGLVFQFLLLLHTHVRKIRTRFAPSATRSGRSRRLLLSASRSRSTQSWKQSAGRLARSRLPCPHLLSLLSALHAPGSCICRALRSRSIKSSAILRRSL
jgi:hypothetical protein